MLYRVHTDIRAPFGTDPALFDRLKTEEQSQAPQRSGKWRHLWRVAGRCANIRVTPLSQHPSAIHQE